MYFLENCTFSSGVCCMNVWGWWGKGDTPGVDGRVAVPYPGYVWCLGNFPKKFWTFSEFPLEWSSCPRIDIVKQQNKMFTIVPKKNNSNCNHVEFICVEYLRKYILIFRLKFTCFLGNSVTYYWNVHEHVNMFQIFQINTSRNFISTLKIFE